MTSGGAEAGEGDIAMPAITSDGSKVAFSSTATLVAADTDTLSDVFKRHRPDK
jgi:hypothetical protein